MFEQEKHVLVVFPHPDDEAFGVSGTIATFIRNGTPLTYACLTLGEMGRNLGNPPFATRESLPGIRKRELLEAAKQMGIRDLRMMGFRDKLLEFEEEKLTESIFSLIRELDPSLIITFYPGYSVHPDHEACGRSVVRAVKRLAGKKRPKLHCVAFSNDCEKELGKPDIIHDIRQVSDVKLKTIKAHRSQTFFFVQQLEEGIAKKDPEALKWLQYERFWSYQWEKDKVE
ncbi:bacillithiol biosynthesis deacetylase BshB2 [Caldibacillus debilis]|uniref:bacillithiol biosynthesis deacetylase BshB2 n=1 Tax=Caldibacillus debilis TaxID=301148 RepID=UPI002FD8FA71